MTSIRGKEWMEFAQAVFDHIENYTVPQYGDKGDDLCSDYTPDHCIEQVKKYAARQGRNQREGQDELDLLKMAHYVQMAWTKKNN